MYCKNCGKTVNEGDRFCSRCGARLEEEFVPAFRQQTDSEPPQDTEKPKKHIITEDFNWDLDGYPTENKRTEEVNFNWDSVLEEKQRNMFVSEHKDREKDTDGAPDFLQNRDVPEENSDDIRALEESIFSDMGSLKSGNEGHTRIASRNGETKSEKIDKFYTFHKKNEEYQALLDQEYERIKNGQSAASAEEQGPASADQKDAEAFAAELFEKLNLSGGGDMLFKTEDFQYPEEKEERAEKPRQKTHEEFDWTLPGDRLSKQLDSMIAAAERGIYGVRRQPEYVGVKLSETPKCYLAENDVQPAGLKAISAEITDKQAADAEESGASKRAEKEPQFPPRENGEKEPGEKEPDKPKLTFDDVFGSDSDDADEKKGKGIGVLRVLAVILAILVVAELAMIGIQHFAPESKAAQMINKGYSAVFSLFGGDSNEPEAEPQTVSADSEIAAIIEKKSSLNKNIAQIEENQDLIFEDGETYGFEDFENSYTFTDRPWYEDEDGNSITYGNEIIATVIQYYSAWLDKINGKNDDVLQFIDDTSDFYPEVEELSGKEGVEYGINRLEIGEIRAGGSGFYVMVSVTNVDSDSKEKTEKQIVYLEPINKSMKIVDINTI